jgi:uncharacterized protein YfaS (alpha-2-macroglobulin family)
MATGYTAAVKDGLKNLKGRNVPAGTYAFQTNPLSLLSARATGTNHNEIDIQLDFNIPVSPSRLRGFLSIRGIGGESMMYRLSGIAAKTLHVTIPVSDQSRTITLNVHLAAGLTGETGALGLEKDEARRFTINPVLRIESVFAGEDNRCVYVDTNFAVALDTAANFVKIEPEIPFTLDSYYRGRFFIRGDFKPRERYTFTFKKGMSAGEGGAVLENDHTQALIFPDFPPSINLPASGMFLSPLGGGRIPVELVNVPKLKLGLWRLYENNIPYIMRGDYTYFQRDLARRVADREFQLSLPLNEKVRRSISIDDLLSADRTVGHRGLFLLTLSNPDYEYWYERSQIVNLSDLGAAVRLWEDGVLVWVNTLSNLDPVAGAGVRLYSSANQLLAEGRTDKDGVCHLQRGEVWEKDDRTPAFVTVSTTERDVTFVKLTRGLLSQEAFDTSGRPWLRSGYDAMIFSARDIYRTSEHVPFKAIVRGHDFLTRKSSAQESSAPEAFPVLFVVHDPLGRTAKRGTSILSEEGSALFEFDLPDSALTGTWDVSLYIPGDESRSLAAMSFSVEDFAPPRIEVKLSSNNKRLTPQTDATFHVAARYLFGADGSGLKWDASWRARQGFFVPQKDKWKPYTFDDAERKFSFISDMITEGFLDEKGEGIFDLSLPDDDWRAPVVDVTVVAEAMEEGGRWVSETMTLPYYSSPWLLGLSAPEGASAVGNDLKFRVAAITPDEEPADPGELTATLYRVTWNYNLVDLDGYTRWQSTEEYAKITSKPVTVKGGVAEFSFKPERWGTYTARISDAKDSASASVRFYADDPEYAEGGSQLLDRVEIDLDKELYKVGDVAKVTLRSPFQGLLLFNVEAMSLIDRKIVKVSQGETVVEVPITEQMIPNAWCAAWLIRPVAEEAAWSAHRAVGIKRIGVDVEGSRLTVGIDVPLKAEPAAKLPVTLTLTDAQGKPAKGELALALVDDGILGLTDFKTPDLIGHFLGQRQMNSDGYDIYDLLMPIESRYTELLHPSGGANLSAFAAANGAKRFKLLSLFNGSISADESGIVKMELDLPEFSGRGRIFAVATSGSRFGAAERTVQIARDIVTEADLPRFAAPGDAFIVPLTVYNSGETSKDVAVELLMSGALSFGEDFGKILLDETEGKMKASIPAKGSHKWDVALRTENQGKAVYTVKTSWNENGEEKIFEQSIDMPVRSPFPVVTLSGSGVFESGDVKIQLPKDAFAEPVSGKLLLSDTPLVNLTKATSFLAAYPYGCLEQTLSAAWPFLILPDAISEIDPLLVDSSAVKLKTGAALTRIQAMQLYDGSFTKWPRYGTPYNWGSVYATHFLVEARKAGVDYPEEMLKSALNWLKQFLASIPGSSGYRYQERDDFTTKAYAAYILALNGEKPLGWLHYLKENASDMWPSGRIWLAGAYALVEGRADALRELGSGSETLVPEALYETLESNVRNTAQLLSIWSEVEPKAIETANLVQSLLDSGKKNLWYSTQENAAVAMALGRYILKTGYEKSQLEGVLMDNGREVLSFRSGGKKSAEIADLSASPTFRATGAGSGYYSWSVTGTPLSAPAPDSKGLTVECAWADTKGNPLSPGQPVAQGTKIVVTLTLTPAVSIADLAVSYLLPAGLEIENPRLNGNEERETPGVRYDVRDDRLLMFVDRLSQKTDYLFEARAVTRGSFVVPPLAAEGMYNPGVRFVGSMTENITIE